MQKKVQIQVPPAEAGHEAFLKNQLSLATGDPVENITGYRLIKRSIDARSRTPHLLFTVLVFINEPVIPEQRFLLTQKDVRQSKTSVIIIGAGPAGLFAALSLIEAGIKPILLERGKDIRSRRRDLALLNKSGILNPESNYCFGEGGAGTYSDGKLYTRSNKRGNLNRILDIFVQFGAGEQILSDAHPHIGTNKLPEIITAMRLHISNCGGSILFEKKTL